MGDIGDCSESSGNLERRRRKSHVVVILIYQAYFCVSDCRMKRECSDWWLTVLFLARAATPTTGGKLVVASATGNEAGTGRCEDDKDVLLK